MSDIEELIENIEKECVADSSGYILIPEILYSRIIFMLKDMKPIMPLYSQEMKRFVCQNCDSVLDEVRDDYCPSCGQKIAWDEFYMNTR